VSIAPTVEEEITEPLGEEANMMIAFAAVQAARRETFLAHYPRALKLAVLVLLLVVLSLPFWMGGKPKPHEDTASASEAIIASHDPQTSAAPQANPSTPVSLPMTRTIEKIEFKNEAERSAASYNDSNEATSRMSVAPDIGLVEETPEGRLPAISRDGRQPWQVYARPFNYQDPRPRIAIVISDLGFSRVATDAVLRRMPPSVTLAFDVEGSVIGEWLVRARQDGHETFLSLPMEPFDYPRSDPGPSSLLTTLPNADNIQRLLGFLKLGTGYIGVTTLSGSRFSADYNKLQPIMSVLHNRGLMVLDTKVSSHSAVGTLAKELAIPTAVSNRVIDAYPTPQAIDAALSDLEQTARIEGVVVGIASPLPVTLERIEAWSKQLAERGIVLAPLTAVVH